MTAIDRPNCGINDIIERSLKLHPQLLVDCLRSHACVHAQFADAYDNREVTLSELDLADRLHRFANAVERADHVIPDDPDIRREAFGCAAWLQDLHPLMQEEIAEREDVRNAPSGKGGRLVQQDNSADRDTRGESRATGSWPFVERRRPGRADYMNRDLIAMLRDQTGTKNDPAAAGERDAAVNSGSAWPLTVRTTYDLETNVLNIQFGPAEAISDGHKEVAPGLHVEFDASGNPIGVEITSVRLRQTAPAASKLAPSPRVTIAGRTRSRDVPFECGFGAKTD